MKLSSISLYKRITKHSLVTRKALPLTMDMTNKGEDEKKNCNWPKSLVILSDAPVLIIHELFLEFAEQ